MEEEIITTSESNQFPVKEPARPASWLDLVLYLLIFVGFAIATAIVGLAVKGELSLAVTALLLVMNFVFLGGGTFLLGIGRGKLTLAELGLWPARWRWSWLFLAVGISFAFIPLRMAIGLIAQLVVEGNLNSMQARGQLIMGGEEITWLGFIVSLIGVGVLAPVAEEMYFRGALYTWFRRRYAVGVAVLISSFIFAVGHADSAGAAASSIVLGMVSAYLFERTQSLWVSIALHMSTNIAGVVLVYGLMALARLLGAPTGL